MKTIILLLFMIIQSLVCAAQIDIENNTDLKIEEHILFASNILEIDNIKIVAAPMTKRLLLRDCINFKAISSKCVDGIYVINIDASLIDRWLKKVISHEMVHIKQMMDERLIITDVITWERKEYTEDDIKYKSLPWEWEASKISIKIVNNFKRTYNHSNLP